MSNRLPPRWRKCPRKGALINLELEGKFLAFKTPLDSKFNNQLNPAELFTPQMLIKSQKDANQKIGLWIDLTKTNRYYDKKIVENAGIKYCKLSCDGNDGAPTPDQVKTFIRICKNFLIKTPLDVICIHCTHGFNRTGFLICSYLIEELSWSVDAAIREFTTARQPGIYKQEYIDELYRRYGDEDDQPCRAPLKPRWCFEDDDIDDDGNQVDQDNNNDNDEQPETSNGRPASNRRSKFMDGVSGVELVIDQEKVKALQLKIKKFCHFESKGFPGSQPVSMGFDNMAFVSQRPYKVSWKADGTRYMMLINKENEVYLFDRDNSVFQIVEGCPRFPRRKQPSEHLENTLLDGEMIIDTFENSSTPRYLIYDIITIDGTDVGRTHFDTRTICIEKEIIFARNEGKKQGTINRDLESFGIRKKDFWNLEMTEKLFEKKFLSNLVHDIDGLIFQPVDEVYVAGQCPTILKWKPPTHNSIDFRVRILRFEEKGCLPETKASLQVGRENIEVFRIPATREFRESDNKIVECTYDYERKTWKFMRVRTDKSFPNSYATATAVWKTMLNPLHKEQLIDYINRNRYQDRGKKRPAPPN